ncbi:MAG: hypothetical protein COV08_03345 [Candidatus Vogelbacteria bacterium CG10_big_fil_rev_8_21_14_0_10_49_38]|uniref:DUF2157 domain-containing protein n=1 Tax=Candidatus Vogelbacteria bacterium CG10_big_fil_rev_8_21_14_0_10_49_38 TaxID=1975043 RepID=A0A2H0RGZ9_9BACT|nr:MAG: hypothetical protein BK006_03340 [bacterium CG10_49_38]PIR45778.1 MAG: hypothetical protein COV08_03345 [Candidatus Vogelbacteria bacterium CG10_big_fil_rev_8_21_14_0_10_49_38]
MNKEDLLRELSEQVKAGQITRTEVMARLSSPDSAELQSGKLVKNLSHFSVPKMLYILGAIIAIVGVITLVFRIWDDLGSAGRILITFGLGLMLAGTGSVLFEHKAEGYLGTIFHLIGGLLIPEGALVFLYELGGVDLMKVWPVTITFGVLFVCYLLLTLKQKHVILTLFALANGTIFTYLFAQALIYGGYQASGDFYAYLTMAVGASYLLLGQNFKLGWNQKLDSLLYFVGSAGIMVAGFSRIFDNSLWEILYLPLVFGAVFLSIYFKSRGILVTSTLALIAYMIYLTNEYFGQSVSWSVSLVITGFIIIGLGYLSIAINKKYLKAK